MYRFNAEELPQNAQITLKNAQDLLMTILSGIHAPVHPDDIQAMNDAYHAIRYLLSPTVRIRVDRNEYLRLVDERHIKIDAGVTTDAE